MKSDKRHFTTMKCARRSALYYSEVYYTELYDIKVNCSYLVHNYMI